MERLKWNKIIFCVLQCSAVLPMLSCGGLRFVRRWSAVRSAVFRPTLAAGMPLVWKIREYLTLILREIKICTSRHCRIHQGQPWSSSSWSLDAVHCFQLVRWNAAHQDHCEGTPEIHTVWTDWLHRLRRKNSRRLLVASLITWKQLVTAQSVAAKHDSTDLEAEYRSLNVDQNRTVDEVFSAVWDGTKPQWYEDAVQVCHSF